jgi:hypothetical protein
MGGVAVWCMPAAHPAQGQQAEEDGTGWCAGLRALQEAGVISGFGLVTVRLVHLLAT